ncbi:MAG TPA: tRNA lysidine(34) synthetase TilS [Syntrophorhabdaceae bacterium]|nr:tRNA lysidine(34) synthetase TilS [Syntrophorhabdaceae bacterium]
MRVAAPPTVRAAGLRILSESKISNTTRHKHSDALVRRIRDIIVQEDLIREGDKVLIGISGGIDSTVMLFLLLKIREKIPFDIGLAHLNHQLRGKESKRDETFVRKLSKDLKLPLFVQRADIKGMAARKHLSLQHAGRDARYDFFNAVMAEHGYNKIAIAHNLDDQVETFLLRSIKGSGLRGISAIPIKRGAVVRPLLYTYRSEIDLFARQRNISFVEDSSNKKTVYERNFVRKEIIPQMEKLNPRVKEKLFALLNELSEVNRLFDSQAKVFFADHALQRDGDIVLKVDELNRIDDETRYRVISECVSVLDSTVVPLREHFRQISRIAAGTKPNVVFSLPNGIKVNRTYDKLIITNKKEAPVANVVLPVSMGANKLDEFRLNLTLSRIRKPFHLNLNDPDIAYIDAEKLGSLTLRTFMNGDRFVPLGMESPVKLKDFFISMKIPREQRRCIPLLCSDDKIVWVIGVRIDDRFKITGSTKKPLKIAVNRLPEVC